MDPNSLLMEKFVALPHYVFTSPKKIEQQLLYFRDALAMFSPWSSIQVGIFLNADRDPQDEMNKPYHTPGIPSGIPHESHEIRLYNVI